MSLALLLLSVLPPALCAAVFLRPPFPEMFGRQAWMPGVLCAAWTLGLVVVALLLPDALWLTALVGTVLGAFLARGRLAARFARQPLPPGSMSFAGGVRGLADRSFYTAGFAKWGPIFKTTQFGAPILCVGGMERIARLLHEHAADLGPSPVAVTRSIEGNFLRYMDEETHAEYGKLFRRAMAGDAPATALQRLRGNARLLLVELAREEYSDPRPALHRFTRESLDLLLFGFTGEDDRSRSFAELADRFYVSSIGQALTRADRRLLEEMKSLVVEPWKRLDAGASQAECVIARMRAIDPSMPDRVCLDNLVLMHKIATNNVSSLLLWLLYYWGTQADIVGRIRSIDDRERSAALNAFLFETLRLSQSEYLYRRVVRDFEFDGFRFPQGWMVRSCIWESHRSTEALPGPTEFRLRLEPDAYTRDHFSPFGMGRHACNGVAINDAICRSWLAALADDFDLRITEAEPFTRRMRHWSRCSTRQ
jgi:cytochrome P450